MTLEDTMQRAVDALDSLEGLEAQATIMRYLGDYPFEQIACELNIPIEMSRQLAFSGLRKVKETVFATE